MANYVGLSRETFNRVLADLENEGFIDKSDVQKIVIKNFPEFKIFFRLFLLNGASTVQSFQNHSYFYSHVRDS